MTAARTGPLSPQTADDAPFAGLIHELQVRHHLLDVRRQLSNG